MTPQQWQGNMERLAHAANQVKRSYDRTNSRFEVARRKERRDIDRLNDARKLLKDAREELSAAERALQESERTRKGFQDILRNKDRAYTKAMSAIKQMQREKPRDR